MYTVTNYETKKKLKEDFKAGIKIKVFQPGPFGHRNVKLNGRVYLEGPHYPRPHKWYQQVDVENGVIVRLIK